MRAILIFFFVASLLIGDDDYDEHKRRHMPLDVSYLDLSQEKHAKLVDIVKRFRHAHKRFDKEQKASERKIGALFVAEEFDKEEFIKISNALKASSTKIQAEFFAEVHKLLDEKQKKRFAEYMREWEVE